MESDKPIIPKIELFPRITKLSKAILGLFELHQLASHGDHFNGSKVDEMLLGDIDVSGYGYAEEE